VEIIKRQTRLHMADWLRVKVGAGLNSGLQAVCCSVCDKKRCCSCSCGLWRFI